MKVRNGNGCISAWVSSFKLFSVIALALLVTPYLVSAQLPTGTILGVVKDTSGGSVPDATVTLSSVETAAVRTATTGADGEYRFSALQPGHYNVKIEKSGFKTSNQTGFNLDVAQELVVNASLEVGTSTQEVTVTGEAPLVETGTSALSGLVNDEKVAELPLNGRDFVDLALLQPGVTNDTNFQNSNAVSSGEGAFGVMYSSNGAPIRSNTVTLDGAITMNFHGNTGGATGATLGVDGIKEFRVITNGFSAEYGLQMGSQTVIVSKGGSNQFHGDVFEYLRNRDLDSRNFFDYSYQLPGAARLPELQRNQFGASFGGPIRKDKTFFYAVFEAQRQVQGQTIIDNTLPAGLVVNGVEGQNCLTTAPNGQGSPLTTGNPCATVTSSGVTSHTVAPSMVPYFDQYVAALQSPGAGLTANNQFTFPAANPTNIAYGQLRVDHSFSAADSIFARYTAQNSYTNGAFLWPQFTAGSQGQDQFITLSENHVFSPTVLNTVRGSFSRTNITTTTTWPASLDALSFETQNGTPLGFGQFDVTGLANFGASNSAPNFLVQNVYTLSDDIFYTKGKHAFKFGTLVNRFEDNEFASTNLRGTINFSSIANMLAGEQSTGTFLVPGSNINKFMRNYTIGFYAQDDWRASSRLTFNLGLRYEFATEPLDRFGNNYAVINLTSPSTTTGTDGQPYINPYYHNFSPRVGVAWDVTGNGKTSVRASFGEYYDVANSAFTLYSAQATPPISEDYSPPAFVAGLPTSTPITFPINFGTVVSNSLHTQNYVIQAPHLLQWDLSVEHQFTPTTELSVAFVGTRGVHLWDNEEGNPCAPLSITNGIPFWGTTGSCPASPLNTANTTNGRLNPHFSSTNLEATNGDSEYQALQAVLTKRVSHGLELQGAFTWGRSTDDVEGQYGPSDCQSQGGSSTVYAANKAYTDRGPSCFDIKDNVRVSVLYHLPTLKGDSALVHQVLGGWWLGSLISWQSGFYFTPMDSFWPSNSAHLNASNANGTTDHATLNTAAFTGPNATSNTATTTIGQPEQFIPYNAATVITGNPQQWFNPLMFNSGTTITTGTIPTSTGYLGTAGRDTLEGPHMSTVDFSINKDTSLHMLGELGALQFRAEFFNIFNHANFGIPVGSIFGSTNNQVAANAGTITYTVTTARQIQLSLKLVF